MTKYFVFASFLIALISCKVDPKVIPALPADRVEEITPPGFPAPAYAFKDNMISENRFRLGRALFYEELLSVDNTVSCGTCHQQRVAFANDEHPLSHGIFDRLGKRNSPGLFNLAWHPFFMNDGAAINMEVQPVLPICNPLEMGETIENVVNKLQASEKYRNLFKQAYGSDSVTSQRMLRALTQFMGLIYSYNSKYDHYRRNENNITLNDQELHGYELFVAKCSSCHKEPLFTDFAFRDIGLPMDPALNDSGRAHVTQLPQDVRKFKTPSLRNIARTGPYMHDGRYKTLEACLEHYKTASDPTELSADNKRDIISFLNALTDDQFALPLDKLDKRFSDPN